MREINKTVFLSVVFPLKVCSESLSVFGSSSLQAQEEMAWQIAKMIVNDVVHQSNHDSPGKSTKVLNLALWSVFLSVMACGLAAVLL